MVRSHLEFLRAKPWPARCSPETALLTDESSQLHSRDVVGFDLFPDVRAGLQGDDTFLSCERCGRTVGEFSDAMFR